MPQQAQDKQDAPIEFSFNGKLNTSVDPIDLGLQNFSSLTNFRYTDSGITGVYGMAEYNTTALTTYTKICDMIHFSKKTPAEDYIVVQAFNTGGTASKIYYNSTAIGSQGDFAATELYSPTGTTRGRFSNAPDGAIVFCNGTETLIWGGNEARIGACWLVSGSIEKDITEEVQESATSNYATITGDSAQVKSPGTIQFHFNNNANMYGSKGPIAQGGDGTYSASATGTGTPAFSSTYKKFGGYSANCGGDANAWGIDTNYHLSSADAADWCVDAYVNAGIDNDTLSNNILWFALESGGTYGSCDYMVCTVTRQLITGSSFQFRTLVDFKIYNHGTTSLIVNLNCVISEKSTSEPWHHIAVTKDATVYTLYVDGYPYETATKAQADGIPAGGWGVLKLFTQGTNYFQGYVDEFHVAEAETYTAEFDNPIAPYPDESMAGEDGGPAYIYIASPRPISGIKLYIDSTHKNAYTSESAVEYWSGRTWTTCASITDGTSSGGKTLYQTGSIAFTSTVDSCVAGLFFGLQAYWHRIRVSHVYDARLYFATVKQPMQPLTDIWDHNYRLLTGCFFKRTGGYEDHLLNVYTNTYDSDLSETYLDASSATDAYELIVGFPEKMMGVYIGMAPGYENANAATSSVYYWNGADWALYGDAVWSAYGNAEDETSSGGATLGKSGVIWWNPTDRPRAYSYTAADNDEYRRAIAGEEPMYYYKIQFSATLDSTVRIFYIAGIPAPKTIPAYSLSELWADRLWLLDEYNGYRNSAICSSLGTNCVFNGVDSISIEFGDTQPITGAIPIFSKSGSAIWENLIVCKNNETYLIEGTDASDFARRLISDNYGCIAQHTMDSCDVEYENQPWFNRNGAIWLSASGPVMFDSNTVSPLWYDVGNYFDRNKSECLTAGYAHLSYGFYDAEHREYHLFFPSGAGATTNNTELCYDVRRKKFFFIDRAYDLQCACMARTTTGILYQYGADNIGKVYRLETTGKWNDTVITYSFRLGDQAIMGNSYTSAYLRRLALTSKAKTDGGNVTITHYGDMSLTPTTLTSNQTLSCLSSADRCVQDFLSLKELDHAYHGIGLSYSITGSEAGGFTPLRMLMVFKADGKIKL